MGLELEQLKTEFEILIRRLAPNTIRPATVTAINDDDTVAVVLSDDTEVDDVRLRSVVKTGNKKIAVPALQSIVLVGRIEGSDEYVVIAMEEIDKEVIVIGTVRYEVDDTGFLFQKGDDTLKEVLSLLIESVQQIVVIEGNNPDYDKLTQALTKTNNLLR
jgi:hypothetical protein